MELGGGKIVTEAQQAFTFTRRALFLGGFQAAIGTLLAGRMAWLAIAQNEKYSLLAESNRVNLTLQLPRRGWIVDRKGLPLALNRTAFRVDIIPDQLKDPEAVLSKLQQLMRLPDTEIVRIKADIKKSSGFQPVQVGENVDWDTFAAVSVRTNELQGVAPSEFYTRAYPDGPSVGHLVGHVGSASARDYEKNRDPLLIMPGFKVGKEGLEKTLENLLRGQPGAKRTEVTARGKLVRELATRPDVPGRTVHLTIDAGLQAYASRRIGVESGAAVVIDCKTGGILALTSMPSFDPNGFSDGIGRQEWKMMQADDFKPLLNKAMQGLYPPGSTVKPAAALALLSLGNSPEETVYCNGGYTLGSRRFRCLGHHGAMKMENAIMKSCNTYFYAMGHRVGYDKIAPVARMLGLGQEYDLPMASQYYGTVPDSQWLKKKYDRDWGAFDSLNATIGQGYVLTTPLQLAVLAARVASGRSLEPSLIKGTEKPGKPLPFSAEQLDVVRRGMDLVVNGSGTAVRSRLDVPGVRMAGKTGTAQVRGLPTKGKARASARKYRDHGLFVFFAPADAPLYAGAVVIEHGMGGARAAAPVAKDMMTYMFEPDKAMQRLQAMEAGWGGDPAVRLQKKINAWNAVHDPEAAAAAAEGSVEDTELEKQKAEEEKTEKQTAPASRESSVDAEAADSDTPVAPAAQRASPPSAQPASVPATPPATGAAPQASATPASPAEVKIP